jgi:DNA-binding NtrC family response regulator
LSEHTRTARGSVLLIDDDQLVAGCLCQYLLANRWTVDVATHRTAAEEMMGARKYSVVVVDPYMTGALSEDRGTLISTARHLQPEAALIVLTGYGSAEMERTAAECRATALLPKPQSVLALSDIIASASQQRIPISKKNVSHATR